ncbi:hypothetical protein A5740_15200 [Mycobacterium sp. GA-1841]|uniref:FadR/GntR family transcriptional regulator n=1 Tax=Mycobacterium sp. GA-1841 TaxID=1834154 RepID=UPI00096CDD43|nr:GntR family transcriptional regulator [Mycobacterium sp. GA-1841]OMC31185.1 hypothetical protein A5740_15200 [Mycobacterium sp. GA-1841]
MQRIARVSLVDSVVARLRDQISSGAWPVGVKIPTEAELGETLGVSRPSIREALRSLVHLGLIETRQGDGTYVIADDQTAVAMRQAVADADDHDAAVVHRSLELLAAREAASRRTTQDLAALRGHLDARRAAHTRNDMAAFVHHDVAFHVGLAGATQNALLARLYRSFEETLRDAVTASGAEAFSDDPRGDFHEQLFWAVQRGDQRSAIRAASGALDAH